MIALLGSVYSTGSGLVVLNTKKRIFATACYTTAL